MKDSTGVTNLDLTTMSAPVAYSVVCDMMNNPKTYLNHVIKVNGQFATSQDTLTGKRYFACIVKDAATCCSRGLEFRLPDTCSYPEDYPEPGTEITVIGTFTTYTEGLFRYCTLTDVELSC